MGQILSNMGGGKKKIEQPLKWTLSALCSERDRGPGETIVYDHEIKDFVIPYIQKRTFKKVA